MKEVYPTLFYSVDCKFLALFIMAYRKLDIKEMNNFFCPLLEKFCQLIKYLPKWGPACPDCTSFCPLSSSGQEKGYFGGFWGCFVYIHILEKCVWMLSKKQGWGWISGQNETPIWAKLDPIWPICTKRDKSALEWGKKIQSYQRTS